MKAIVKFSTGSTKLVNVAKSYSTGGTHYYLLVLNQLSTFLDFIPGEKILYTDKDITSLKYIMG